MKFNCPFCGIELSSQDVVPGDLGDCPNCGREFSVPSPEGARKRTLSVRVPQGGGGRHNGKISIPAHAGSATAGSPSNAVNSGFGGSLVAMLFNPPIGVVAVVLSALSEGAQGEHNDKARIYATAAGYVRIASWVMFVVWAVILVVLSAAGAFKTHSYYYRP